MALFKPVKKPIIRQTSQADSAASPARPRYAPKASPCVEGCPIGCDVRGMLTTIAEAEAGGRTAESALELAWQRITVRNPFPSVCGRICSHPCEASCLLGRNKEAVAVNAVERFAGDYAIERGLKFSRSRELPQSVAVTSVGPAGLSAACHLARRGYRVVMFDGSAPLGGILRANVPHGILEAEVQRILDLGVEVQVASAEIAVEKLRETHAAVVETAAVETNDPSAVAAAIAGGLRAAEYADAQARSIAPPAPAAKAVVPLERLRPEWYKDQPRIDAAAGLTIDGIVQESRRCMSCGMCMGCGNCWSYCTKSGFERVSSGRRFKLKLDRCNGCGKCSDGCPSGYIDMA